MNTISKVWLSIFLISFISCTENKTKETSTKAEYEWEVLDSLDLNILGSPLIADVNTDASNFLFYDFASGEIITTSKSGDILNQFSKKEDTPDAFGFMMELPGFYDKDQVAVLGMNGLFLYDLNGTMIKKINHPESIGGAGFMSFPGKSIESVTLDGKEFLLTKSVRPRESFPGEQEFYDTYRALEIVDVASETMKDLIPFEEGSLFLNGKGYFESDYTPAFEAIGDKLYIAMGADPKLYQYTLSTDGTTLDTTVLLTIPGFRELEPKERAEFAEGTVTINGSTPAIRNIHKQDNLLILEYYPGMDPEKMEELEKLWMNDKADEAEEQYEKIEAELEKGVMILSLPDMKILGNLLLPPNANTSGFASGNGFLWLQKKQNPEVEEDFLRIYKMKIVEK